MSNVVQQIKIEELKPHPLNYRDHPPEQLAHLCQSLKEHGFYKNIVVANDNTILAGHGIWRAALSLRLESVPIIKLNLDPMSAKAKKIIAGDNEAAKLAVDDDRMLTSLLKDILTEDDLLGTGFDDMALANLIMTTRPIDEIADKNEAAEWAGMPAFDTGRPRIQLIISFRTEEDRQAFTEQSGVGLMAKNDQTWSGWYPPMQKVGESAIKFEEEES